MNSRRVKWLTGVLAVVAGLVSPVFAVVQEMGLADIVRESDLIVKGKVAAAESRWASDQRGTHIYTLVTVQADTALKGMPPSDRFSLEVQGGTVGDITETVSDAASFAPGEEVVLFLKSHPLTPVGGFQGKFLISQGKVLADRKEVSVDAFLEGIQRAIQTHSSAPLSEQDAVLVHGGGQVAAADVANVKKASPPPQADGGGAALTVANIGAFAPTGDLTNPPQPTALTAVIREAWWTLPVDIDLDGYKRSARLNWDPNVAGGTGSLNVFERLYYRPSYSSAWTFLLQMPNHVITGTATNDTAYFDIVPVFRDLYDFRIDIYRVGVSWADSTRGPSTDSDLDNYRLEPASQDVPIRAFIENAWWTNRIDNDGDGFWRAARLNWDSDVVGGSASLSVYERVYYKAWNSSVWTFLIQTLPHTITGWALSDAQYLDLSATSANYYDFKIEVYRSGVPTADYTRSETNDSDLNNYPMESGPQDGGGSATVPRITDMYPPKGSAGTNFIVTITGVNFGDTPLGGRVDFFYRAGQPKIPAQIISWTNTQIMCRIPIGTVAGYPASAGSGPVTVVRGSDISNGYTYRITFGYGGTRWAGAYPAVNYRINQNTADCVGEGAAVQAAAQTWTNVGARLRFQYAGATTSTVASGNGRNEIMWGTLPAGVIASAWRWTSGGSNIESDVVFNDAYLWSTAASVPTSRMDVQTIALHELGHWLTLRDLYGNIGDRVYDNAKVMYGFAANGLNKRVLHAQDREGIAWIYGY